MLVGGVDREIDQSLFDEFYGIEKTSRQGSRDPFQFWGGSRNNGQRKS
jgi:hypothetical protein